MKESKLWTYEKTVAGCQILKMPSKRNLALYRVNSDFENTPPKVLVEYFGDVEKRKIWDNTAYDEIK